MHLQSFSILCLDFDHHLFLFQCVICLDVLQYRQRTKFFFSCDVCACVYDIIFLNVFKTNLFSKYSYFLNILVETI